MYVCERGMRLGFLTHEVKEAPATFRCFRPPPSRRESARTDPITMRETLLLALLSTVAALRVGTGGLSRRAAIAGGAAVTLLPPPGFASSGSMAGKTVLIVRWPQVEPPSLHATSD